MSENGEQAKPGAVELQNGDEPKAAEQKKEQPVIIFFEQPTEGHPARLVMAMDLDRINPAWARGACMNAADVALAWYNERAKEAQRTKLVRPGMAQQMKDFIRTKLH